MGCNLQLVDKKQIGLVKFAVRHNKLQMKEALLAAGAKNMSSTDEVLKVTRPKNIVQPQKARVNEKLLPKKFVLQVQDGDIVRPMTQEEFEEELVKLHPEIAKIFEDENEIKNI